MLSRGNPLSHDLLAVPEEALKPQIDKLLRAVSDADTDMLGWLKKQAELVKLRLGDRRPKSTPWRGASNISVPLIDGIIRRFKPGIASLVVDADPIAHFQSQEPSDFETARNVEPFFTFLFREYMDTTFSTIRLVDLIAWRGHAYTREGWSYRTAPEVRICVVRHLFPGGVEEIQELARQLSEQAGQEIPPEDIVSTKFENEYGLSRESEEDMLVLTQIVPKVMAGAEYVRVRTRTVCEDRPSWKALDPINVIVPQDQNPETAEFFCVVHHMTPDRLKSMARDGHLRMDRVNRLIEQGTRSAPGEHFTSPSDGERQQIIQIMDRKAGTSTRRVSGQSSGLIPVWEVFCYLDLGTGERERCILWYAPKNTGGTDGMALSLIEYPFPFDTWPITYYPFEAAARPIDNRGIAEMLRPHQKIVNAHHNARIDAAQITLAPVLQMRAAGAANLKKGLRWAPGSIIPVGQVGDVAPIVQDLRILGALLQEEQSEQRLAETYVGVFDATLTNLAQGRERRTATEIDAVSAVSSSIFGLDAKVFQTAFSKSLRKVWRLYMDLGPEELFFRVQNEELPRSAKKSELSRDYDIRAAGTPANTSRTFQIRSLQSILQIIMNPIILQSGRTDWPLLVEQLIKLMDVNVAKSIIRPPQESTAVQQVLKAAAIASQGQVSVGGSF